MRLSVTTDTLEQLFDPEKRSPEREHLRQESLRKGRELRARSLRRQNEKQAANACD